MKNHIVKRVFRPKTLSSSSLLVTNNRSSSIKHNSINCLKTTTSLTGTCFNSYHYDTNLGQANEYHISDLNDETVAKWTQTHLQTLIIQLYSWKNATDDKKALTETLTKTIDGIVYVSKQYMADRPDAEDIYPQLIALQVASQYLKEHELSKKDDSKLADLSKLSFSTSKLQSLIKRKTDLSHLPENVETVKKAKEEIIKYLNEMNGIYNILQCTSLSKIILQKLLFFQYDASSFATRIVVESFLEQKRNENLVMSIFGTYFQLSAVYEREGQLRNAVNTLIAVYQKLEEVLNILKNISSTQDVIKHIASTEQYIRDLDKRLSILFERVQDFKSSADHLKKLLPKENPASINFASDSLNLFELKTSLLKLGYLYTMANEWKSADSCYEDLTFLTARQLNSLPAAEKSLHPKFTSQQIVLDSVVLSYEWSIFLRKMLLVKQREKQPEQEEESEEAQNNALDIPSRLKTIKRLLDIGTGIGQSIGMFSDEIPSVGDQPSSAMLQLLKDKVEIQACSELCKLQLSFIKGFLSEESENSGWDEFAQVWDNLLMSITHVLTFETNIKENHPQIWNQLSVHFFNFKEVIINEALHLLRFAVTQMREHSNHALNREEQFESYLENIVIILSRNEDCFENKFKIWAQLRSIHGSYIIHRMNKDTATEEITKSLIEKEKIFDYCEKVARRDYNFDLPFLLHDILVEVFENLSEDKRKSLYKRAYRILAPTKEIAHAKALQFESWVLEGKQTSAVYEGNQLEAEIDRSIENTEKQTVLFLRDLMKEEQDGGEYLFAGIVNTSAKALAP
ncbi:predicted protein [Naegleria gruberi]|uniref:Predicted protein n=1 Tax=Naegleria gruberi TaxID=5762 RepID=D2V774_NAEGR|nr:uncharacterized protein NAEGRDRAFT_64695 [Naegleria gruberi]EFC47324.1 predicted protein [Naegleria gruberi]|eukprot:XP_002680068.1 predicted protein [Naegleria gruberi strain NEG-M]